ncbi:MAG: hypothetical protein ACTSVI_02680 [Promethearchaeota archaeon]
MKTIFGTCGIRRKFTEDFSGPEWLEIGMAIGTYLGKKSVILIGRDTRQTAELVQYALISGLVSCGCEVHVLHGSSESPYVTTSTMAYCTKHFKADCGIQVTASHNTPEYIGIKIWQNTGMGFTPAQEEIIDQIYTHKKFQLAKWNEILKVKTIFNANDIHLQAVLARIKLPLKFNGKKITVAVDPGNGAACEIAPKLLQKLGVNVVSINAQPDGIFPGRYSEPTEENLKTLIRMIKSDDDLHLGIAYDGDADRVRFVDGNGRLVDGDVVLLIYALFSPVNTGKRNNYVVTPVNSSSILDKVLNARGMKVSRTRIGDINVAIRVKEINAKLGGEVSGTYTWPCFHYGPDALYSTAMMLYIISRHGSLEKLHDNIPKIHVEHHEIEIDDKSFSELSIEMIEKEIQAFLKGSGREIKDIMKIDGVMFKLNGGFILVRKSGTSSLLRLTVEHENKQDARIISDQATSIIKRLI